MDEYTTTLNRAARMVAPQEINSTAVRNNKGTFKERPVIIVPPPHLKYDWLNPDRAATLTRDRLQQITSQLAGIENSTGLEVAWWPARYKKCCCSSGEPSAEQNL